MAIPSKGSDLEAQGVSLRDVGDGDLKFLEQVYADTRLEELKQTDWSDA